MDEYDTSTENDRTSCDASPDEWFRDNNYQTYELRMSAQFEASSKNSFCLSGSVSGEAYGVTASTSVERCSEWTDPGNSYVFYFNVY